MARDRLFELRQMAEDYEMTNKEYLAQLQQRAKTRNDWRILNPNITPDLVEADVIGTNLAEAHLNWKNHNAD
jgi:hypothetical protein